MKKIIVYLAICVLAGFGISDKVYAQNQIRFIYIHGTNDNNIKKKRMFTNDVKKLHPYIVKEFNKSATAKKYLLEDGKYKISETPLAFYWGAESKKDLNFLSDWLDITKFFSPKLAQTVRSMLAHTLHDAIWIQKYNNMKPIVDRLHSLAKRIETNGDKYVLLGHSAGSFITYEYILYKLSFIPTREIFTHSNAVTPELLSQIEKIGYKTTCLDALVDSDIVTYKRDNTFEVKPNDLIKKYKNLENVEKMSCASNDSLTGVINFGSPVTLFYSGFLSDKNDDFSSLVSSVINNNLFYLNLNFAEDPLGFPITSEYDYAQMMTYSDNYNNLNINTENPQNLKYGFIFDKSDLRSNKSVVSAHSGYWKKYKYFSKSMIKAYESGINTFMYKSEI